MTTRAPVSDLVGCWYRVVVDGAGRVDVMLVEQPLAGVAVLDGRLVGAQATVSTRAVLVEVGADGALIGRETDPLVAWDGRLCFDPSQGGIRTRENRRARGAFNAIVAEANRFGMVNAYVHTDRAASLANRLIAEAGGVALPRVGVVVGAHFGSRLPGYAQGDGDLRSGALRPLSGGHYRLSSRTSGVPEPVEVAADGEIHLGCSRYRKPYAGWASYLRNAAHNPAITYHEFGHHLCRHTADFRLNAERAAHEQRNGKTGIEEGVCDYFAAVLLGSGRPYGWYRADRGRRRDPEFARHASELDGRRDAHADGAIWAAAWWRARLELPAAGLLGSPQDHDRALVAALLRVGTVGRPDGRRSRRRRERRRSRASTTIDAYLEALREAGGARAVGAASSMLEGAGLLDAPGPVGDAGAVEVTATC